MNSNLVLRIIPVFLLMTKAMGAEPSSFCLYQPSSGKMLESIDLKQPIEIGSMTKLFTTAAALEKWGPEYRTVTQLYAAKANPMDHSVVLAHLKGGRDPVFGARALSQGLWELFQLGAREVNRLSYDSNFWFYNYPYGNPHSYHLNSKTIAQELTDFINDPARLKVDDPQGSEIFFPFKLRGGKSGLKSVDKMDFNPEVEVSLQSPPLLEILKSMNRRSNNMIAQNIFLGMGGVSQINRFLAQRLGPSFANHATIYNGSGMPEVRRGKKIYNLASCEAVLSVVRQLDETMKDLQLDGIQSLLPIAGDNVPNLPLSTVSQAYKSDTFRGVVAAKTGTVNPSVSLAGVISTKDKGPLFFSIVYSVGTRAAASTAWGRNQIRQQLGRILMQRGRGSEFSNWASDKKDFWNVSVKGQL